MTGTPATLPAADVSAVTGVLSTLPEFVGRSPSLQPLVGGLTNRSWYLQCELKGSAASTAHTRTLRHAGFLAFGLIHEITPTPSSSGQCVKTCIVPQTPKTNGVQNDLFLADYKTTMPPSTTTVLISKYSDKNYRKGTAGQPATR